MGMLQFKVTGVKPMQRRLMELGPHLALKAGAGLREQGDRIMDRSKAEFVPVKTGALKASGRVEGPYPSGKRQVVELIYGGAAVTYALEQHETPWYFHPVGQWKYLEQPMKEAAPEIMRVVAARMMRGYKG